MFGCATHQQGPNNGYVVRVSHIRDFQQFDILTIVDSDEPVQPPFKLRISKRCSASSLTLIDERRAKALIRLRVHCWKSHALAYFIQYRATTEWRFAGGPIVARYHIYSILNTYMIIYPDSKTAMLQSMLNSKVFGTFTLQLNPCIKVQKK